MTTTHVIVYETEPTETFHPLSLSHPVFDLLAGTRTNLDRIRHHFGDCRIHTLQRPHLPAPRHPLTPETVAALAAQDGVRRCVLLDGGTVFRASDRELIEALKRGPAGVCYRNGNRPAATVLDGEDLVEFTRRTSAGLEGGVPPSPAAHAARSESVTVMQFDHIWDPVGVNADLIRSDFEEYYRGRNGAADLGDAHGYRVSDVVTGAGLRADAASVVDARGGPVILEAGVAISPMVYVEGPAFVGRGSRLVGGKLTGGCSIGPGCRIGGEVEASIFIGNSNKYHEGFIGHAYVGEWVNLGALTTNSDLANNYSEISVKQRGVVRGTGCMKIGSFIGDHTKIGIGMTLNTGAVIGFSCNLFGGSLILEKEVPSFAWGNDRLRSRVRLEDALRTAETVMARRDHAFGPRHAALFERIYREEESLRDAWAKRKKKHEPHKRQETG